MKKIMVFITILSLVMGLVSCDLLFSPTTTTEEQMPSTSETSDITTNEYTSSDTSISTTADLSPTTNSTTTAFFTTDSTINIDTTEFTTTTALPTTQTTTEEPMTRVTYSDPIIPTGYSLLQDELESVGIPTTGDVKVLVFVVDFPDNLITNPSSVLNDTNIAFNGGSSDLPYESLHSYYQLSSFGKLNLTADIFGVYTAENNASYYEQANDLFYATDPLTGEYLYNDAPHPDSDIIYELLVHYNNVIDYKDYDSNLDGYIDGIYVMYNHEISYENGSDLWWAYQYYYWYEDSFDQVSPNYYVWAGIDFLYEGGESVNARTIIHETGHMLGLDDYYDYYPDDIYNSGGLGTFMMDYTIGDHDVFSKILLGWITPIVIEDTLTIDLSKHITNGEVLLIIDQWNNTIFDEYFLVMYYTPEGLNELDQYNIFTIPGVIIFHISAQIDNGYNLDSYYYSIFNNNNTDSEDKLIKIIEADMSGDIDKYAVVENSDLFLVGDGFGSNVFPNYRWYDESLINLDISVISIDGTKARIEIIFN